jgi:drug/metabolite transporter (DMT)-like permease
VLAFAAVYVIWGSTYLGIKIAIETIPPFLMAGTRFIIAGALLYFWSRRRGAGPPTRAQWRSAAIIGALLFLGGNGALTWAEERVDSGLACLLLATIPLWMVLLAHAQRQSQQGARHNRTGLGGRVIAGLALGIGGIGLLVGPSNFLGHGGVDRLGAAVLLSGALAWAVGSLYSPKADLPRSTLLAASMEMLCGGALLVLLGLVARETAGLDLSAISVRSILGISYLITFGSLVGFTSYNWLLSHASPARVATYAYVNPVVAVFLGWAVAHEKITLRTLAAAALVVAAVALIITHRARPAARGLEVVSRGEVEAAPLVPLD